MLSCFRALLLALLAVSFSAKTLLAEVTASDVLSAYGNNEAFEQRLANIGGSQLVKLSSLGQTAAGRDIRLLTVGNASPADKPAVLLVGSVEGDCLVGSELTLQIVEQLLKSEDDSAKAILDELTLYVIPRPSPDANERLFASPTPAATANSRPMDDDRDGELDEDPAEDLNGDGLITSMRVEDEAGNYILRPDDDRLLIEADPTKGERGKYRLLTEGLDNDGDKQWNEDGPGGVRLNRNFAFEYPYFQPGAGPHQISEPESRAIADFCYEHPNIFLIFSIGPQDNLHHPWSPGDGKPGVDPRIKKSVDKADAKYLQRIAERYQDLVEAKDAPDATEHGGAFAAWAYYHYGRWSLATRGWWLAKESKEEGEKSEESEQSADDEAEPDGKSEEKADDKDDRGAEDLRALKWFESQGVAGFIPWKPIDHPDFPGKRVEVGGFVPAVRNHPPLEALDAEPLVALLCEIGSQRSSLAFAQTKLESLGGGIHRVTAQVVNRGQLPTASAMGKTTRQLRRLEVEIRGPEAMKIMAGSRRQDLGVLAPGEVVEKTWLAHLPESTADQIHLRAGEPSVGFVESGSIHGAEVSRGPEERGPAE